MAVKSPALTAKASGQITARHPLGLALIEASTPILVEGDAGLPRVGRWLKRLGHGRVQRIAGDGGWRYRATGSSLLRGWRSLRPPSRWPSGTLSGGIGTPVDSGTLRKDRPAPAACVTTPLRLRVGPGPTLRFAGAKREPIADPWKALARGYLRPTCGRTRPASAVHPGVARAVALPAGTARKQRRAEKRTLTWHRCTRRIGARQDRREEPSWERPLPSKISLHSAGKSPALGPALTTARSPGRSARAPA